MSDRITPAYAGKRSSSHGLKVCVKDHPRLRGEKENQYHPIEALQGSPPLTRGKDYLCCRRNRSTRITPAYAGKSLRGGQAPVFTEDHPRLRGEKLETAIKFVWDQGSPPLTRGKDSSLFSDLKTLRITPAYAGKRSGRIHCHMLCKDHPRLRGEKLSLPSLSKIILGSPPLTRGKDLYSKAYQLESGITPAYAGKSTVFQAKSPLPRDHPRLRGEKEQRIMSALQSTGSPPLTRGKESNR